MEIQNQEVQPIKKQGISTVVGIIIIIAVALILFGGVFAYQYFFVKPQPIVQTPQAQVNQTAGWKTYTNSEYGFEIKYPEDLPLTDQSSSGILNLKLYAQAPDYKTRSVVVASKDSSVIKDLLLNEPLNFPGTVINGQEKFGSTLWSKKEVIGTPVNGIGTYGDWMTYYFEKNNLTYTITCFNCVAPPDGGADADAIFKEIISTFKFTTPDQTADWKTYTNSQYGFTLNYSSVLTLASTGSEFSLNHSVPFKHPNPCNLKDGASIDVITDFNITGTIENGNINDVLRSANYYGINFDSNGKPIIDENSGVKEFKAVNLVGYSYSMGVEGCGVDVYYLSLKNNKTLVLRDLWVGEFSTVNGYTGQYDKLTGIILPDKHFAYLNQILSTFKFTTTNQACTPDWKCDWVPCKNGLQGVIATDSNKCGLPVPNGFPCPTVVRECNP